MKRITLIFLLILIFSLQFPLYMQYGVSEIEGYLIENCSYTDIKTAGIINDASSFYNAVSEYTKNYESTIFSISYELQSDSSERMTLYVSGKNYPDFFKQMDITDDDIKEIENNGVVNLRLFNPKKFCDICSFKSINDKSLSRTYYIYPTEKENDFKSFMEDNYDVVFFTSDELLYINSSYMEQIPEAALMLLALMVFWAFWIVNEYQLNAVKKLQGFSDFSCGRKLYRDFVIIILLAVIISQTLQLIVCAMYNRLANYRNLFFDSIENSVKIFVVTITAGFVLLLLFYNSNINYALKGKRPYKLLVAISAILKIITIVFLCTSVFAISNNIANTNITLKQTEKFKEISNYRSPEFRLTSGSGEYLSQFERSASEFYERIDSILISDRKILQSRYSFDQSDYIDDNTIYINDEYLKLNPVVDCYGSTVKIDEYDLKSNETLILVPEKYRNNEDEIYTRFFEWYQFSRYVTANSKEVQNVNIRILFVKDGQTYFAYNTELEQIQYNYICDPFAVIVTKENMDDSNYADFLLNSEVLFADNSEQTISNIFLIAKETGVLNDLSNLPTVISKVDNIMQHSKNKTVVYFATLFVSVLIVCIISIYIIKCYTYQNRKLFFVKKMNGYCFWSVYGRFIGLILLLQIVLFLIIKFILHVPVQQFLMIMVLFNLYDSVLMVTFSLKYQEKISKDVLKGEGV